MQLLGSIGVAASPIFVGLELRQSQQIAIVGQVHARNQAFLNLYTKTMGEDPIGRSVFVDGYRTPASDRSYLSEAECDVWSAIKSWQVMSLQNAFQQYEMGLLAESAWEQVSFRILARYSNCSVRPIFFSSVIPSMTNYL